eukprot:TRINITY_DN25418_c0_g1_i1.p1 TRINITY_DN25418_c0_g1~~TRINITY_DN25418_c0_g1_i1.p1  ORF type:complete len:131 (-),score=25.24 TRINITY_DN25418_c0_g1_i1:27-419(-)
MCVMVVSVHSDGDRDQVYIHCPCVMCVMAVSVCSMCHVCDGGSVCSMCHVVCVCVCVWWFLLSFFLLFILYSFQYVPCVMCVMVVSVHSDGDRDQVYIHCPCVMCVMAVSVCSMCHVCDGGVSMFHVSCV